MKIKVIRAYSGEEGVGPDKDVHEGSEHIVTRARGSQLKANGLVEILSDDDADSGELRTDGPTVTEFVAAGYQAKNYPPAGYTSRSTDDEIAAAIKQQEASSMRIETGGTKVEAAPENKQAPAPRNKAAQAPLPRSRAPDPMRVVVVTPPAPVIDLAEAKAHLRVDHGDDDALIAGYVAAATGHIDGPDGWLGRSIGAQTLELHADVFRDAMRLPYGPIIEIVSVSHLDASGSLVTLLPSSYEVRGHLIGAAFGKRWPSVGAHPEAVRIRYLAGYPVDDSGDEPRSTLPPAIRAAILLMVGDLYRYRGTAVDTGGGHPGIDAGADAAPPVPGVRLMSIDPGRLDRRIRIERATTAEDALGSDVESWAPLGTVSAQKLTQRATEAWRAGGTASQREVVWRVRWSGSLASMIDGGERDRIVHDGHVYPVSGVVEIGRREGLEITTNPSGQPA